MSRVIDLTLEDEEMEDQDDLYILEPSVIPFINYTRVPRILFPFVQAPLSPTKVILTLWRKAEVKPGYTSRKLTATVVGNVDLEWEIFNSGKLYFLTKLFQSIANSKHLTNVTILVLTLEFTTEKLLYRVFTELYGYPCVRLSRAQEHPQRCKDNVSGTKCGVIIRLMAGPKEASHNVIQRYEYCSLALVEYILLFDGGILPIFLRIMAIDKLKFVEDPCILDLCTIGTSEFRFKEYISRSAAYKKTSMEIFAIHANEEMKYRFKGPNVIYPSIDFLNWNNLVSKQVADWILSKNTLDYHFTFPYAPEEDVLKEFKY
ncbi:unnamed protein product [Mucor hiemalis]